ncbi:hypothetical protein KpIITR008_22 [Klebsiella phage KpIITR008]
MIKYDVYNPRGVHYRIAVDRPIDQPAEWYCKHRSTYFEDCAFSSAFILLHGQSVLIARNVVFKDSVCSQ